MYLLCNVDIDDDDGIAKPVPIMLEIYLLFFPEFPKNFAHYSFVHYLLFS